MSHSARSAHPHREFGTWLRAIAAPDDAPATLVLNDKGRAAAGEAVSDRVNRGEQVLALDVIFNGEMLPSMLCPTEYELIVASMGDRPVGVEAGQLIAAAKWLAHTSKQTQLRLQATGIRSQVLALVAAALEPRLFSEVAITGGMHSLGFLLDTPVEPRLAPELFCLDLYKDFDLDQFRAMAAPTKVSETEFAKPADLPDEPPNED